LLQDGASPQHVRNDPHSGTNTQEQQAFEGYTNARVLKQTSNDAGLYVRGFYSPPFTQTLPPIELGNYPVPKFATPVRFYTTRLKGDGPAVPPDNRYGIMDYANRSFFTGGTLPGMSGNTFQSPPSPIDSAHGYTQSQTDCFLSAATGGNTGLHTLKCTHYMHSVLDNHVAPGYIDVLPAASPAFTAPPLAAESAFRFTKDVFGGIVQLPQYTVGLEELDTMANLGVPRAIGYSAGLLNYFFRGQLTLTSAPDKVVGVLNQGAKHTMNAQGYPCVGTATTDGCAIFGFQSVRVNVKNTTPQITESGTGTVIPQNLSATAVGSVTDPAFHGPYLVAVAKYHRNTCYKPDLSGERQQSYSVAIPTIEPTCTAGQVVRTAYQEISVSKSAAVTAAVLNGTTASEVHFDFSSDPIPVNATDLFIQVVYRGPMGDATLGQEADAIAVGTLDVREPTFASFWNNTDSWWNESIWGAHDGTYLNEGVRDFWVCGGTFPPKLLFEYYGALTGVAMVDAVGSNVPGQVRLGILFPPPDVPGQGKILRGTPVTYPGVPGTQQIPVRSPFVGSGAFRQANLENVLSATLSAPYVNCGSSLPVTSQFWCFDTIQKRRGQLFGATAQPLYLETPFGGTTPTDVDAAGLAAYAGTTPLALGTLRFDTDTTLLACPSQPTITGVPPDREHIRQIELLEEARSLGVSGEEEPPLQQRK
jgi:hypothetical protein